MSDENKVIIRVYRGSQDKAVAAFQEESAVMAKRGYYPTSQSWAPGTYGCGAFLGALLLCFLIIGFVIFLYMLFVKPDGALSVTYELREDPSIPTLFALDEKTCPQCAEQVKAAALVCRYCSYKFTS